MKLNKFTEKSLPKENIPFAIIAQRGMMLTTMTNEGPDYYYILKNGLIYFLYKREEIYEPDAICLSYYLNSDDYFWIYASDYECELGCETVDYNHFGFISTLLYYTENSCYSPLDKYIIVNGETTYICWLLKTESNHYHAVLVRKQFREKSITLRHSFGANLKAEQNCFEFYKEEARKKLI